MNVATANSQKPPVFMGLCARKKAWATWFLFLEVTNLWIARSVKVGENRRDLANYSSVNFKIFFKKIIKQKRHGECKKQRLQKYHTYAIFEIKQWLFKFLKRQKKYAFRIIILNFVKFRFECGSNIFNQCR